MSAFVVVDLESTNREPVEAHIVEWAAVVVTPAWFGEGGSQEYHSLVRPPIAIPPETSAVHHIIDADVIDAPTWETERLHLATLFGATSVIAVAHNAEYERTLLAKSDLPAVPWLCTYKAALRVWPECPSHSNECLRYFLGLGTGRKGGQAPHSALHDARVTSQILAELLRTGTLIEDMVRWTNEPALLPRCPIGKFRNMPWADVEQGFLDWILYKAQDMREDIKFCAKSELDRREKERAAQRPARVQEDLEDDEVPF